VAERTNSVLVHHDLGVQQLSPTIYVHTLLCMYGRIAGRMYLRMYVFMYVNLCVRMYGQDMVCYVNAIECTCSWSNLRLRMLLYICSVCRKGCTTRNNRSSGSLYITQTCSYRSCNKPGRPAQQATLAHIRTLTQTHALHECIDALHTRTHTYIQT
jgi:hypothetical protein